MEPLDINRRGQVAAVDAAAGHRSSSSKSACSGGREEEAGCLEPWTAAEPSKQKSRQSLGPSLSLSVSVCLYLSLSLSVRASARHHPSLSAYNVNGLLERRVAVAALPNQEHEAYP